MAVLSENDRLAEWADYMRSPDSDEVSGFTKQELRAAVDAADDWAEAEATNFNAALPLAFRTAANAKQKARLLMAVLRRRYEVT